MATKSAATRAKRVRYPCAVCEGTTCATDSIECSTCREWVHQTCTPVSDDMFRMYGKHQELKFVCKMCAHTDDKFDFRSSLLR
jgi:hypothetical protein